MNSHVLIQKSLAIFIILLAFSSCNQQEFYEKEYLDGVGVPDEEIIPEATPTADEVSDESNDDEDAGGIITTPSQPDQGGSADGGDDGASTDGGSGDNTGSTNGDGGDNTGSTNGDGGDNTGSTNGDGGDNTGSTNGDGGDNTGSTNGDGGDNTGTTNGDGGDNTGSTNGDGGDNTGTTEPGICGEGTLANASDEFIQNTAEQAKVDILWVMDNSGSMSDEQEALAYNFNAFISSFIEKKIDFKMAITTTDASSSRRGGSKSGLMVGDSNLLTSGAANNDVQKFMDDFSSMIKVGTSGSGAEKGLKTSNDFFDRYRDWARQDAYLIVVYISDEEDQSSDFVSNYVSGLQALKASAGMVKAYSIVTQDIDPSKQWETIGNRYMEASRATGGEIADIHQNFYTTLSNFGFRILDLLDSFPLSGVPVGSEISVTVNNVELASGWTYDEAARSIKFDETAIPDEGEIIIAYYQKCVMSN